MRIRAFRLALVLVVAACSDDSASDDGGTSSTDLAALALRIDQIQLKATHNSYHVEKAGNMLADWNYTRAPLAEQASKQGVRGFELDTHFDAPSGQITVHHIPGLDDGTTCELLEDCLLELKSWSDAHEGHQLLFIQIEPKDAEVGQKPDYAAYGDALDALLLRTWGRKRIVAPADVQGDADSLREGVMKNGFPTVESTRGKLLVYLDNRTEFHAAYTHDGSDVHDRLVFPSSQPDEDLAAVIVSNDPLDPATAAAVKMGFLVRTRADVIPAPDDISAQREAALSSGAQIITTDFPVADGEVDALDLPGGTPSRCNPVTAADGCRATDIEDL